MMPGETRAFHLTTRIENGRWTSGHEREVDCLVLAAPRQYAVPTSRTDCSRTWYLVRVIPEGEIEPRMVCASRLVKEAAVESLGHPSR